MSNGVVASGREFLLVERLESLEWFDWQLKFLVGTRLNAA